MLSISEYDTYFISCIKKLSYKKYQGKYNKIISSIKDFDKAIESYNKKEMAYSTIMYQVKYLRNLYFEQLLEVINTYQAIVFPDFSNKNEVNSIINSPFNLKIWFLRYLCLKLLNCDLSLLIKDDFSCNSITNKYDILDNILFTNALKSKVINK